jgi:thioredoxin 1
MKLIKLLSLFSLIILVSGMAPNHKIQDEKESGISFHTGTWAEALALAKKENKLIFLDISAIWCGPCKMLKKNTFTNIEVGKFYNSNFINVMVDGEKGEGITLAQKYAITAYPTLFFIDGNGKVVKKAMGYHNPQDFLKLGQSVVN